MTGAEVFVESGMSATDQTSLHAALSASERDADRFYGKYRGIVVDNDDPLQHRAAAGDGARTCSATSPVRLGAAVRPVRRNRRRPVRDSAGRRRRVDRVRGGRRLAADLDRRLVGDGRGARRTSRGRPRCRRARSCAPSSGLMVSLDESRQTITISDADGLEPDVRSEVAQGTIEIRCARRAWCSRRR